MNKSFVFCIIPRRLFSEAHAFLYYEIINPQKATVFFITLRCQWKQLRLNQVMRLKKKWREI